MPWVLSIMRAIIRTEGDNSVRGSVVEFLAMNSAVGDLMQVWDLLKCDFEEEVRQRFSETLACRLQETRPGQLESRNGLSSSRLAELGEIEQVKAVLQRVVDEDSSEETVAAAKRGISVAGISAAEWNEPDSVVGQ